MLTPANQGQGQHPPQEQEPEYAEEHKRQARGQHEVSLVTISPEKPPSSACPVARKLAAIIQKVSTGLERNGACAG